MDPQQRLMLETAWRALEQAGYRPQDLPRHTGVFVGVSGRDYASLLEAHDVPHDGFAATGNSLAMVANRISHFLDVRGPSEAIDTACSSSLVALVRAADAMAAGRCSMALVGGVNLALAVEGFEGPHLAGMLSADGRCKTFSADADGYGRGEGCVALLLKPLADAVADGDNILGVMIGGAVNHGGRAGALTAPNAKAQAELIEQAMAGIDPASIGFIETHGTGTALGDPVEIAALSLAYEKLARGQAALPTIGLGAVKSNIGHLEAAAGLAGVVKVLGAMARGMIPPTLHCREINPHIQLDGTPFSIVRETTPWPRRSRCVGCRRCRAAPAFRASGSAASMRMSSIEEYADGSTRRPPLPARAFADTRFWIPGQAAVTGRSVDETVLHVPRWVETDLPRSAVGRASVASCSRAGSQFLARAERHVVDCSPAAGSLADRYTRRGRCRCSKPCSRSCGARCCAGSRADLFIRSGTTGRYLRGLARCSIRPPLNVPSHRAGGWRAAGARAGSGGRLLDAEARHPQHRPRSPGTRPPSRADVGAARQRTACAPRLARRRRLSHHRRHGRRWASSGARHRGERESAGAGGDRDVAARSGAPGGAR